ncbi:MAG: AAA family ATPase, partial [Spirochaetota bacterium]
MISIPGYQTTEQSVELPLYESSYSLVYRSSRSSDNQAVILKMLNHEYPSPGQLARFTREYEITHDLRSDGVSKVFGLEKYKNTLVMVFEDFGGEALTKALPLFQENMEEFLNTAIRIVEILGQVHQEHIMHKDINPANIIWNKEKNVIKLVDFGISTKLSRETPAILNPNVLEGTLVYMSPEQTGRMNRAMDYRTDFYSLGVTFYEMLTGQLPFSTDDPIELVHCHIAKVPTPPHEIDSKIPLPISQIIMKLMAKRAEERYQSTFGLKVDLQQCLDQLMQTGSIEKLEVGQQDISDKFQIPQKLYGREQEIQDLLQAFDRVSQGETEMMLVAGYSGIGKSVVVHEVHKPIVAKNGFFLSGKFDQFKRNIPYSSLIQAFQGLVQQLLTETEEQIAFWKEKILKAVGSNGQVIIEMIPELELIIGEQPPVAELPPTESRNRFNLLFQHFVATFGSAKHPMVLFLDDLQWADPPSLKLIELFLTDPDEKYILIIGAYRDNEVDAAHPLMAMLEDIQTAGVEVRTLTLPPLELKYVNQLISDTLKCDPSESKSLAELSYQKTEGNPFFLNQFLQSVYEAGLIEFDSSKGAWTWDVKKIQVQGITDNVVDLMAEKIKKHSQSTQEVLQLAASIGNRFDLKT